MVPKDKLVMRVNKVAGSQRNHTYYVTGIVTHDTSGDLPLTPIDLEMTEDEEKRLKLASLVWLVQEKMGLYLWWDKETLLLPMESRNTVRFDTSIKSPDGWNGTIYISGFNFVPPRKVFFFVLDFDK